METYSVDDIRLPCHNLQHQYIDRIEDIPVVRGRWRREAGMCFLKMVISVQTDRLVCSRSVTSELSSFHGWIDDRDSEGEVVIEIIGCGG